MVDPTIRYETNNDIGQDVQAEKEGLYASCAKSINDLFANHGKREFRVFGLWVGGRGTISREMEQFFKSFRLDKRILPEMAEMVLSASIRMLHHHINGP